MFHAAFTICICNGERHNMCNCLQEKKWSLNSQNMQPQAFHWDLSWTLWKTPVIIVDDKNYLYIKHIDTVAVCICHKHSHVPSWSAHDIEWTSDMYWGLEGPPYIVLTTVILFCTLWILVKLWVTISEMPLL